MCGSAERQAMTRSAKPDGSPSRCVRRPRSVSLQRHQAVKGRSSKVDQRSFVGGAGGWRRRASSHEECENSLIVSADGTDPARGDQHRRIAGPKLLGVLAGVREEVGRGKWGCKSLRPKKSATMESTRRRSAGLPQCLPLPSVLVDSVGYTCGTGGAIESALGSLESPSSSAPG